MADYTGQNLAVMSTILTGATKRDWSPLGTFTAFTQEEVQMMRVGDALFISCNKSGHTAIQNFLTAFAVSSEATFINSLKYSHAIMNETKPVNWKGDIKDRAKYSAQDTATLSVFSFPTGTSKIPAPDVITDIYNCVGKQAKKSDPAPTSPKDWKVGPFQQLLGIYSTNVKAYEKGFGKPLVAAKYQNGKLSETPKMDYAVTVVADKSTVHAELKLLALLTRMVVDGKVEAKEVQLGGAKGACRKCAAWIDSFSKWLTTQGITLKTPENDERKSADSADEGWGKPELDQTIKGDAKVKDSIADLFG